MVNVETQSDSQPLPTLENILHNRAVCVCSFRISRTHPCVTQEDILGARTLYRSVSFTLRPLYPSTHYMGHETVWPLQHATDELSEHLTICRLESHAQNQSQNICWCCHVRMCLETAASRFCFFYRELSSRVYPSEKYEPRFRSQRTYIVCSITEHVTHVSHYTTQDDPALILGQGSSPHSV
jgi:hypothetical protein